MKLALILLTLMLTQLASAQTLREKRIKEGMLERVGILLEKAESVVDDLKSDKKEIPSIKKVSAACKTISELFAMYPEHLKAIGGHLDLFDSGTVWIKNETLNQLIFVHRQSLTCQQGKDHEYLDPTEVRDEFKLIIKSLEKQKKKISKASADFENSFYYEYEF